MENRECGPRIKFEEIEKLFLINVGVGGFKKITKQATDYEMLDRVEWRV